MSNTTLLWAIGITSLLIFIFVTIPHIIKIINILLKKTSYRQLGQSSQIRLIKQLQDAVEELSKTKTGALITIMNKQKLDNYRTDGVILDANISSSLIISIFNKNSPLHDGAIIINNNKIIYASTYFKITTKSLTNRLGARHRAAMGISEQTDATTIVVSEQTGAVSFFKNAQLKTINMKDFQNTLIEYLK